MKNIKVKNDKITIYRNSRVHLVIPRNEILDVKLVKRRRRRWLLEVVLSILVLGLASRCLFWLVLQFQNNLVFPKGLQLLVSMSMLTLGLLFLGLNGLRSFARIDHIVINGSVYVEIDKEDTQKVHKLFPQLKNAILNN